MAETSMQNQLLQVFPRETWNLLAQKMKAATFVKFRQALPEPNDIIKPSTYVQKLFPEVFNVVFGKSYIGFEDAKHCRNVCSSWMDGVDVYFQTNKFYSIENIHGAKNLSALVLRMPLEMIDINRIYELDLHPRCVSLGKKLVLTMQHDERNPRTTINHLREVNALLQSVRGFWERFEHLEVRRAVRTGQYNANNTARRRLVRLLTNDNVTVPFGDTGAEVVMNASRADFRNTRFDGTNLKTWYRVCRDFFDPYDFEMGIPFLHLMTNLKKVSLLTENRWMLCHILLRIPRTENLEEIHVLARMHYAPLIWFKSCAVMYQKCANKVSFLTGVNFRSLAILADQIDASGHGTFPVFEKLKELHISIADYEEVVIMERLSRAKIIARMFPNVKILQMGVDGATVPTDLWFMYSNLLVNQFPSLEHFSMAGACIPDWCETFQKVCLGKTTTGGSPVVEQDPTTSSEKKKKNGLIKFQFTCPMHVPVRLLNMLPSVKQVIVEEWPRLCRRRASRSSDWKYISGFFQMFPKVSSLTFVPVTNCREIRNWLWGPGAVTRCKDDDLCQRRKRKTTI